MAGDGFSLKVGMLNEMEPKVVNLTVSDDHPEFSVRMPLHQLPLTHDDYFVELRYFCKQGKLYTLLQFSNKALSATYETANLELGIAAAMRTDDKFMPACFLHLDNTINALIKLKLYHESGRIKEEFKAYGIEL